MPEYLLPLTFNQLHALRRSVDRTLLDIAAQHEEIADGRRCVTDECRSERSDYIFLDRVLRKIDALIERDADATET